MAGSPPAGMRAVHRHLHQHEWLSACFVRLGVLVFAAFTHNLAKGNPTLIVPRSCGPCITCPDNIDSHSFLLRLCVSQNFYPVRKAPTTDKRSQCRRGDYAHLLSPSTIRAASFPQTFKCQLFPASANHQDYIDSQHPSFQASCLTTFHQMPRPHPARKQKPKRSSLNHLPPQPPPHSRRRVIPPRTYDVLTTT